MGELPIKNIGTGKYNFSTAGVLDEGAIPTHMSKNKLAWADGQLLKGAGAGADPIEIERIIRADLETYILTKLLYDTSLYGTWGVFLDRFVSVDGWTQGISGSGSTTHEGILSLLLSTGATSGSYASRYTARAFATYDAPLDFIVMAASNEVADATMWLAATVDPTPGDNVQGFGWKIVNRVVYAWNSDGTNNNLTNTGVSLPDFTPFSCWIEHRKGAADIKYYWNSELKATHTTYLPNSYYHLLYYISNQVAANRVLVIKRTDYIGGGVGG